MNYRGHCLTNTAALVPVIFLASEYQLVPKVLFSIGLIGYALGTLFLSPDLDIYSRPYNNWGRLRFIWLPYQRFIRHRSFLSHSILVGTLFRSIYLSVMFVLISVILVAGVKMLLLKLSIDSTFIMAWGKMMIANINQSKELLIIFVALLIGIEASSLMHILTDKISSKLKI